LLLIEKGTDFPTANLDADTEWIPFVREAVPSISNRLVAMIGHLIAQRMPSVVEATKLVVAPVAAVGEITDQSAENQATESTGPSFSDVMTLVQEKRFSEADEVFERFRASQPLDDVAKWFSYYFLRVKAINGGARGLQTLQNIIKTQPGDVDARTNLADYYRRFKNYDKATQILLAGVDVAREEDKPNLIRRAATSLSQVGKFSEAYELVRGLCARTLPDGEKTAAYICLADIAKTQRDGELESAALEMALSTSPANADYRFRLAYHYSEMSKARLAVFHYKLRLAQGPDGNTLNNLGVSLSELKLESREIATYETASAESAMAKANLSHAYIDRGFLRIAAELAASVVASVSDDGIDHRRAAAALQRIAAKQNEDKKAEEKIENEAREEAAFRADYTVAFVSPPTTVDGVFRTPYGDLAFAQDGTTLRGTGMFTEQAEPTLGELYLGRASAGTQTPQMKTRTVSFEATLTGRAGRFKVTTTEERQGLLLSIPNVSEAKGLVVVAGDGVSFRLLEEKDDTGKLQRATKLLGT